MKKIKTSIICSLMVLSALLAIPAFAVSQGPGDGWGFDWKSEDPADIAAMPDGLFNALGGVFGMLEGLGPSGRALGEVFKILFLNIFDFTFEEDEIKHVYKLSASYEETETYNVTYDGREELYWIREYNTAIPLGQSEHPYVTINRTGTVNITYTSGAAVVFLIWDNNDSFINAINKVITAAQNVKAAIEAKGDPSTWTEEDSVEVGQKIAGELLSAITYLIFHINDNINGDELIVLNMITWEKYTMDTSSDYTITKEYKIWDDWNLEDDDPIPPSDLIAWNASALANHDDFMLWLLEDVEDGEFSREWSRFSFNLIEIWFKTFQIYINVPAIIQALNSTLGESEEPNPLPGMGIAEIFEGLDIEIYIMTHSLMGFIAYEDENSNDVPDVTRTTIVEGEVESEIITGSEARYYFAFGGIGDIVFNEPELTDEGDGYTWSIELQTVQMVAVPIGMSPSDLSSPVFENLDYIELGFTFTPKLKEVVTAAEAGEYSGLVPDYDEVQMAKGIIKLDQYFSAWNGGTGPNHIALQDPNMDFSVIYVSTILHFRLHFEVETVEELELAQNGLADEAVHSGSINASGTIKVGDYTGDLPVAAVDIAGPEYIQGDPGTSYPASTCTIPLAFLDFDASAKVRYEDPNAPSQSFEAGGFLNISSSILIYAVNYPTFNGSGDKLWHDPTFSVFMQWDNPGFWAVILVIAGITLVAVAAILITRRKNRV
ncbi:MAG: hypothetical protein JW776_00085 [Candidatus Lokiarchaeota archaeon]|nr:hypothetical protein [Candidatus Lokiarchaeota archaeon]